MLLGVIQNLLRANTSEQSKFIRTWWLFWAWYRAIFWKSFSSQRNWRNL